jgi:DNA repair exonuclease SbcCD ATPase subunit
MAETTRSSTSSPAHATRQDDEKLSLFWRVFGGTILSIIALGAITLYNNLSSSIAELRGELNRERETRAEMVKKDEFNSRGNSQSDRIRTLEGLKAEFEGLKERASANAASLDGLKKDVGGTADIVKKDAAALDVLKEKAASAASDLKSIHDDVMKVQQEQERNRTSDLERKTSRDIQHKQVEDSLKELQKGLQDCREKLARMEGMQPVAKDKP